MLSVLLITGGLLVIETKALPLVIALGLLLTAELSVLREIRAEAHVLKNAGPLSMWTKGILALSEKARTVQEERPSNGHVPYPDVVERLLRALPGLTQERWADVVARAEDTKESSALGFLTTFRRSRALSALERAPTEDMKDSVAAAVVAVFREPPLREYVAVDEPGGWKAP